jgi:hypothetical protein
MNTRVTSHSTTTSSSRLSTSKESNFATQAVDEDNHHDVPKDWKFWCIIFSLALSVLLTATEFVSRLFYRGDVPILHKTYRRPQLVQPCQQLFVNLRESSLCGLVPHMHWAQQPLSLFMAGYPRYDHESSPPVQNRNLHRN